MIDLILKILACAFCAVGTVAVGLAAIHLAGGF